MHACSIEQSSSSLHCPIKAGRISAVSAEMMRSWNVGKFIKIQDNSKKTYRKKYSVHIAVCNEAILTVRSRFIYFTTAVCSH
jgi:hypothetical protein